MITYQARCAPSRKAEEPLVGQQIHTWADLDSLLCLDREHSITEVKATPWGRTIRNQRS